MNEKLPTHDDAESEAERVEGWDDLREVIDRACVAVSKGDAPDAIGAYLWSCVQPRLSHERQLREEAERHVRKFVNGLWEIVYAEAKVDESEDGMRIMVQPDLRGMARRLVMGWPNDPDSESAETQLERCQEERNALEITMEGMEAVVARLEDGVREIERLATPDSSESALGAALDREAIRNTARSALSQQSVPNTPETE